MISDIIEKHLKYLEDFFDLIGDIEIYNSDMLKVSFIG